MSSYVSAPGQAPPICQNCSTSTTPLWRRDESGSVLCNACGLFLKLHGRPRPISLKTDVIKSRNRVKTGQNGQKKKSPFSAQGLPAAHPEVSSPLPGSMARMPSMPHMITDSDDRHELHASERSTTPSGLHQLQQAANIAPSHMFDAVTMESGGHRSLENSFASPTPYYSAPHARHGSPLSMLNGAASSSDSHSQIQTALKTRISELEVINELFRGRVTELENTERDLRQQLEESLTREQELRRRVEELEASHAMLYREDGDRQLKRLRTSDFINDDSDVLESQPQQELQAEQQVEDQQPPAQVEENKPEDAVAVEVAVDAERAAE